MTQPVRLFAGAMSGTSADGVDVALVQITGHGMEMACKLVHHHHRGYDPVLKEQIFALRRCGEGRLADLGELGRDVSLAYAAAINEALLAVGLHADKLTAIAAHGQTLFHQPPLTIQWLDPALIAAEVGCPVVSDFRRADCAAGGQGAPLVPFADYILFRHPSKTRVLLNLGGIANLTHLPAGAALQQVVAFDTGPGNCISDHLMRSADKDGPGFDPDGQGALQGAPDESLIYTLMHRTYFLADPPKTTDVPSMIALWEDTLRQRNGKPLSLHDALATACLLCARAVALALRDFTHQPPDELIVSGGGIHNRAIMNFLQKELSPIPLLTSDQRGIGSAAKEALAFALLGAATMDHFPANVPNATGAHRAVVLGSITPKP